MLLILSPAAGRAGLPSLTALLATPLFTLPATPPVTGKLKLSTAAKEGLRLAMEAGNKK